MTKTYFLTPGWDFPSSLPLLGTTIANPSQPDLALTSPPPSLTNITTTPPQSYTSPPIANPADPPTTSLFHTFLTTYGLGSEPAFTFDRKHSIRSYSFRDLQTARVQPSQELLSAAAADAKVATLFANKVGVYLIVGVKTVRGAGVTVASSKGRGWDVNLEISAGGEEGVVVAVEVVEVKRDGEEVVVRELDAGEERLQARLDGEFGAGTFRVVKGVEEEGGEEVQIVTASGTYVDLLTASTAKVGGEHGIWY
ncbi:hypothetical protein QBC34DRAFT_211135 [Podospora aff. communis PSN243]|uniref:Uncharacterized protein n=1 Tax=Podospora aff. communis PSN243 TaxID=3040156 RepID=A0AAV9G5T9_9PEZI|nr:hypothetical protein QBC34DRAFT_211135 [Podospora aff. communis PSN243]